MTFEREGRPVARYVTKTQFAADSIRDRIRRGDLRPGERIDPEAIGAGLGMSATPIREALRSLESQGLVTISPHRGMHVAEFSPADAAELYDLRAHLEAYATALAAPTLTREDLDQLEELVRLHRESLARSDIAAVDHYNEQWHFGIYRLTRLHTPHLLEFIGRLWNAFPWTTAWMVRGRGWRSVQEHALVMQALRDRDASRAGEAMATHILSGKRLVIEHLADAAGADAGQVSDSRPGDV